MGDQGIEAASFSKAATSLAMLNEPKKQLQFLKKAIAIADSSASHLIIYQAYSSMGNCIKESGEMERSYFPFTKKLLYQ